MGPPNHKTKEVSEFMFIEIESIDGTSGAIAELIEDLGVID